MWLKKVNISKVDSIIDQSGKYYRNSRLYLSLANSPDAYKYYIEEYRGDIEKLIEQGYTYEYKGNYIVAHVVSDFREKCPVEFEHWYGVAPFLQKHFDNNESIMFIPILAPVDGKLNANCFKLINEFVKKYGDDYVILTDCFVESDINLFIDKTRGVLTRIIGNLYLRWN